MKNNNDKIIVTVFFIIIFSFLLLMLASRGGIFSKRENKMTAKRPEFTSDSLFDGEYFQQLDSFYTDNVPFKDTLAQIKAACEVCMLKLENNGIIVLDRLVERQELSDTEFEKSAEVLEKFKASAAEGGITLDSFIIPASSEVKGEGLFLFNDKSQKHGLSLTPQMYYRTDHHLNNDGAYEVYCQIASALSSPVRDKGDFVISENFLGRSYYTSAIPYYPSEMIVTRENDLSVNTYIDGEFAFNGFIDGKYIGTADEYSAFFGSNHAECYAEKEKNRETLLIIKDSYALSVCPYLLDDFNIAMVDARYAKRDIGYYIDKYDCDRIILLCGREHFESPALRTLLSGEI